MVTTWLHFGCDKKDKIEQAFRSKFRRIKWIALAKPAPEKPALAALRVRWGFCSSYGWRS